MIKILGLSTGLIRKDFIEEDIKDLYDFDEDFNGTNGNNITKEAIDNGFNSDLDYYYDKYNKISNGDIITINNRMSEKLAEKDHYEELAWSLCYINDTDIFISIAYVTTDL